jgi:beta-carotene hydroxylase
LLPEKHNEIIKPHMHPNLEQGSMSYYVYQTYINPGKRINYDGSDYLSLVEGDDEPWFYSERETHSDIDFGKKYL